jgi:hypothetical protein
MKRNALLILVLSAWLSQAGAIAGTTSTPVPPAPGGKTQTPTTPTTPPKTTTPPAPPKPPPPPPPPIAGKFDHVDPKHPGICFTKYDQQYPCSAIPPPPPSVTGVIDPVAGGGRADGWDAKKYNEGMYDDLAGGDEYGQMSQTAAFAQMDKVLLLCVHHNVEGRPDDLCTTTPNHPECTGLKNSMENATNCAVPPAPGAPAGAGCKGYGNYGYVIDEWLVFGEQYYNGMGGCLSAKTGDDKAAGRSTRMINLTDISSVSATLGEGGAQFQGPSTITGKINKQQNLSSISKRLSDEMDDGATALGYERGEFFTRALKGQSFSGVFADSPFAGKLAGSVKEAVDTALGNSKEVRELLKDKRIAEVEKIREQKEKAGESTVAIDDALAKKKNSAGSSDAVAALDKAARVPASAGLAKELVDKQRAGSPGVDKSRNWLALSVGADGQVKGSGIAEAAPSTLSGTEGEADISLFQRVRLSYRRIAPSMNAYGESKTARDVRLTDTPQFFRDL